MKKIYFLASAVVLAGSLSAQKANSNLDAKPTNVANRTSVSSNQLVKKAPGDVLWSEDFQNGLGGNNTSTTPAWSTGYAGATDYTSTWKYDTSGPTGQYTTNAGALESSTADNGWMLFDINATTDAENNNGFITADAWIQTPAIDVSMMPSGLGLEIEHLYRTCCANANMPVNIFAGYVDDATGLTWTQINSGNTSHNVYPPTDGSNVSVRLMNISCVTNLAQAQTNDNSVYIRFHWNSALDASSSYYFWMIDDVKIVELTGNDASHDKMYAGDIYNDFDPYIIPQSQAHAMIAGSDVRNLGANDLTNLKLNVTITEDATTNVVYTGASTPTTLTPCDEGKFTVDAENTLTNFYHNTGKSDFNLGVHTIEITTSADADDDASNNTLSQKFEYSEYEYGHYRPSSPEIGIDLVNDGSSQGSQASLYAIKADGNIYGVYVNFEDGTTTTNDAGITFTVSLWNDAFDTELISKDYELSQDMIDATGRVALAFDNPYEVFAGEYYYAMITAYGDGDVVISSDYDGDDDNSTLLVLDQTYGASSDPYINLCFNPMGCEGVAGGNNEDNENFDLYGFTVAECLISVEENDANITFLNNTPNPATNNTTINYSIANADNVSLTIVDITGKVVATLNEGTKTAGAHSIELSTAELTNGVYFYTLTAGQAQLTNKMIVNK